MLIILVYPNYMYNNYIRIDFRNYLQEPVSLQKRLLVCLNNQFIYI